LILDALGRNPLFISAALPSRVFPPLFNRYQGGQSFGTHVDNAIRQVASTGHRLRTDLSATLFFTGPDEYEGGELDIEDTYGLHTVKLPAGHLVLYPATSLHHVRLLFDLDSAIQQLNRDLPNHASSIQLTGIYHNLLRRWAEL